LVVERDDDGRRPLHTTHNQISPPQFALRILNQPTAPILTTLALCSSPTFQPFPANKTKRIESNRIVLVLYTQISAWYELNKLEIFFDVEGVQEIAFDHQYAESKSWCVLLQSYKESVRIWGGDLPRSLRLPHRGI